MASQIPCAFQCSLICMVHSIGSYQEWGLVADPQNPREGTHTLGEPVSLVQDVLMPGNKNAVLFNTHPSEHGGVVRLPLRSTHMAQLQSLRQCKSSRANIDKPQQLTTSLAQLSGQGAHE